MSGLRLALVARRFWPLTGETERTTANLAAELLQRGHRPIIVTPKYGKNWPPEICVREVPVVRLPHPAPRSWGNVRYLYSLTRWLQQRNSELDAVLICGPEEDAVSALGALRGTNVPLAVRAGCEADTLGHGPAGGVFGERLKRRSRQCDAYIASTAALAERLQLAGYPVDRIHEIASGVTVPPPRSPAARDAARLALIDVNHDLASATDAPIALCLTPLVPKAHVETLVQAWRSVQARWPDARLWVVGDGPSRDSIFGLLSDYSLKYRVVLPGTFDDWHELLQAADLLIQPADEGAEGQAVLEAMAAGLPVIACGSSQQIQLLKHEQNGLLCAPADVRQLAAAITRLIEQPRLAVSLGTRARRTIGEHHSLEQMVERHVELFQSLVQTKATGK